MAELSEISEGGDADAVGAAGGGTEGGAQGVQGSQGGAEAPAGDTSQGQGSGRTQANQPPPMPPRTAPCLNSIQVESVKEYMEEIRGNIALTTKNISAANYCINSRDKLIPQINRSLSEKNNPTGPVIQSLVNQVMSAEITERVLDS